MDNCDEFPFCSLIEYLLKQNLPWGGYNILPTLLDFTDISSNIFYYNHGKSNMNECSLFIVDPTSICLVPESKITIYTTINQINRYVQLCNIIKDNIPSDTVELLSYPFNTVVSLSINPFTTPQLMEYNIRDRLIFKNFKRIWSNIFLYKLPKKIKTLRNIPIQVYIPPLAFEIKCISYFKDNDGRTFRFKFDGRLNYYLHHPRIQWR